MQKLALIQNQVYMSYSSKSDVRPLLESFGYHPEHVVLYTAHNIKKLRSELESGEINAVIFTSNSLSEESIRDEVSTPEFKKSFGDFLGQGKGCLILHQLNAIPKDVTQAAVFDFLPIKSPAAVKRENKDAMKGDFKTAELTEKHPLFHYPSSVSIEDLKRHCIHKKGLYWHFLDDVDTSEWDVLLFDEDINESRRPLLLATREASKLRVVLSALNLDWQKEEHLLKNLVNFVVEGKCDTAIIKDESYNSLAFEFFLRTLKSYNYRYQLYNLSTDFDELKKQIQQGTHSIVVLGPTDETPEKKNLLDDIEQFLRPYITEGKVKYIGIEPNEKSLKQFFVAGREKLALRILQDTEIKIQHVLQSHKLIDNSFWSTVDTLRVHRGMKETFTKIDKATVEPVFEAIQKNIVDDASYNGLLVPTASLLWLRATYLGAHNDRTQKTVNWMKATLGSGEEIETECIVAYNTFLELGIEPELAIARLKSLIWNKDLSRHNEIEIIPYIKTAILLRDIEQVKKFTATLESKRNDEKLWIDISTSANIVDLLLEALEMLKKHETDEKEYEETIENLVFPTIIMMQNQANKVGPEKLFHWENKANTTLKCVSAILNFEGLIDLPVTEMVQSLLSYSETGNRMVDNQTAIHAIETFKSESLQLKKSIRDLKQELSEAEQSRRELAQDKQRIEDEHRKLLERTDQLKDKYDDLGAQLQTKDIISNVWVIVLGIGICSFLAVLFVGYFFLRFPKALEQLSGFYHIQVSPMSVISVVFTAVLGSLGSNLLWKRQRGKRQQSV